MNMKKWMKWLLSAILFLGIFTGCTEVDDSGNAVTDEWIVEQDGWYSSKEEVAAYLIEFECLPENYLTKNEAYDLGWDPDEGNLWDVAEGMSIGGDKFGNREGLLPKEKGRQYYECDIDYEGGYRNEKRIVYSNDGLIYYTDDHYESFEEIVGDK
ncbi:MAG: ribonuclease [Erysipelotrichaceae bacterium]|nr:ribonuclease [Erysipelotrichaceae bacterium]